MATAQSMLRELLRVHVAPALRAHGYNGSGQNFHRRIDGNWAAINIQRDRYSTADEVRFTINLGTASTVVRMEDGEAPDDPADEVRCHWRTRLGDLLPGHRDTWWTVNARMRSAELDVLGETLATHLVDAALAMLDRMAPDEAILRTYLNGEPKPGLSSADMDVIGPILRRLGPAERFARYLAVIDADGADAASAYTMWDDFPPAALGPARIAKRMARLTAKGFEPRQQAIIDLGYATPDDTIRGAIRPALDDPDWRIRFAAAQSLGRLGDVSVVRRLMAIVADEPVRMVAVHAAFALRRLDQLLEEGDRHQLRATIRDRRDRAVGHDRAALSHLIAEMGPA